MTTRPNTPEFTVSDLAGSLKKTIEGTYAHIRVRGELSRVSIAGSGHMYSSLKDDGAVIDAVCWKGVMSRLSVQPEEGLEVICTGRLSTFPKRSNYQLVIESMELAGEGALLKMLEARKRAMAAEGLFAADRKRPIPKLPKVIGVVTSPTGAVIRDILHRLSDRMPSRVIVWPALVQGAGAAEQVAAGIEGLQALPDHGLPKPDVIIVARGGGSLEDLMPFNEEVVVRAAAACRVPLISAVGHETDTTLIDYASDLRAPTPTGAAEMVVPVRVELLAGLQDRGGRLTRAMSRLAEAYEARLSLQARSLMNPHQLIEMKTQGLDFAAQALSYNAQTLVTRKERAALQTLSRLRAPVAVMDQKTNSLERASDALLRLPYTVLERLTTRLSHGAQMLEAYSFHNVLKRGYCVAHNEQGGVITRRAHVPESGVIALEFYGGEKVALRSLGQLDQGAGGVQVQPKVKSKSKGCGSSMSDRQDSLF